MKKVFNDNIRKILIYFVFYSFMGFLVETIFGIFSKGVLESRQSFLLGPFCAIYGIGAIFMIFFLKKYKGQKLKIFLYSIVIGTISEYLMSYICEKTFGFLWWDYSNYLFNINGRVCLAFSISWGILGILLIEYINPAFEKILKRIKKSKYCEKINKLFSILMVFLSVDVVITIFSLNLFYLKVNDKIDSNQNNYKVSKISYLPKEQFSLISEQNMLRIYPNLRIVDSNKKIQFVDSYYPKVKTYYFKIFNK